MNDLFNISSIDLVGHLASLAVLSSFLMKDMVKLRLINMVGCSLFVAYGFLLNISLPIIITNSAIFSIHIYYLYKGRKAN